MTPRTASAFLGIVALAASALSAPIPIQNPGFEDTSVGVHFNEFTFGPPAFWSLPRLPPC